MKDANQYQFINDTDEVKDGDGNTTDTITVAAATIMVPGWAHWSIGDLVENDEGEMVPRMERRRLRPLVLPGNDGKPAPVFAGGSNIGISAQAKLAKELMKIIFSEIQTMLGQNGLGPWRRRVHSSLGDDQFARPSSPRLPTRKLHPRSPGLGSS